MSDFSWAEAKAGLRLLDSDDPAPDGVTPDQDEHTTGNIALVVEGCAIYGQPSELLELLAAGVNKVSAHLAGQL